MELNVKDSYRIETSDVLSEDAMTSLVSLYQPIIGLDAVSLYLVLHSEGRVQRVKETHERLSYILNRSIDDIERARVHLEEYKLLKTFVSKAENKNAYLYVLQSPLPVQTFLQNRTFMSAYQAIVGKKNAEITMNKFHGNVISTDGYEEITRQVTHMPQASELDQTVEYSHIEPRYQFDLDGVDIQFDYQRFFATTSTLVFPAELRTQENLKLIGKLATIYGIPVDKMRHLVGRCVNLTNRTFDDQKLKFLASKEEVVVKESSDPYLLPPASFLQAKQNGAPVSMADKKLLEYLAVDMQFSPEVINIMIEYILKKSQNRLVQAFVQMVAGEWARDGVKTREDAIRETKKKQASFTPQKGVKKSVLPEYYQEDYQEKTIEMSDSEKQRVQEMLKKMGG